MIGMAGVGYALPGSGQSVRQWCEHAGWGEPETRELLGNGAGEFYARSSETSVQLGALAIARARADASCPPEDVDVLVLCQTSPCNALPPPWSLAGELRRAAGLSCRRVFSVMQQQCVSVLHAVNIVRTLFERDHELRAALVVAVDNILQEKLRPIGTAAMHSDASSAIVLRRQAPARVVGITFSNDPHAICSIAADGRYIPNSAYLWSLVSVLRRTLRNAHVTAEALTSVIPHNVNLPAWRHALEVLSLPQDILFTGNFARTGHAFGSDMAINVADSRALAVPGRHLVFASGLGGAFGGLVLETGLES
jgi:3-oxoacyl-[acyl-carrier-protein] synthase III